VIGWLISTTFTKRFFYSVLIKFFSNLTLALFMITLTDSEEDYLSYLACAMASHCFINGGTPECETEASFRADYFKARERGLDHNKALDFAWNGPNERICLTCDNEAQPDSDWCAACKTPSPNPHPPSLSGNEDTSYISSGRNNPPE